MPSVSKNGPVNGRGEIPITRLVDDLSELALAPLRMVVAPAGYGKSTLLRQLADRVDATGDSIPIRYTATSADVAPPAFVRRLATAFGPKLGSHATRITQLDTLLDRLGRSGDDFTVLVDDADRLAASPSSDALTRLLNEAPPNIRFVVATRDSATPAIAALTSVHPVHRLDHRDLRLRPWEVELLFRSVYRRPVTPEVAAALCSWTEGWPAALYMVHLDARHGELSGAGRAPWLSAEARAHVVRQVLRPVPAKVQDIMVRMSTLGVLSGGLCDALLDRTDSARLLRKLTETQVLTWPSERDGACYRFHRLLQLHLEHQLAERLDPDELREWYRRAARQLIQFGHWPEACRAYARAEDWVAVGEVLHHRRDDGDGMFDAAIMPKTVLDGDPWLMLARARLFRADGALAAACHAYDQARSDFDQPGIRWRCAAEHAAVARWLPPGEQPDAPLPRSDDPSAAVFEAMRADPGRLLVRPPQANESHWRLARAVAAVLDGRPGLADTLLAEAAVGEASFVSLAGRLVVAVLATIAHRPSGTAAVYTTLALEAETSGWPWLARMARAATALADPLCCRDTLRMRDECRAAGDEWGELVVGVVVTMSMIRAGTDAEPALRSAIATAHRLGASVPELWLRVLLVDELARTRTADALDEQRVVATMAGLTGVPRAADHGRAFVAALRARTPTNTTVADADPLADADGVIPPVLIRCLGPYEFLVDGARLDLSALRPQARLLLRLLSLHTTTGVRDEKLITAIWPDTPPHMARHRLHVAMSAVRRVLREATAPTPIDVVRNEDAYLLRLPEGSEVDLLLFEAAVRQWRANGGMTARDESIEFGLRALRLYRGDLLGADESADGSIVERDRLRTEAAAVAAMLATHALNRGDIDKGIRLARRGLQIDELNEQLWQLMAQAQRRSGNEAAARRALRAYADLCGEAAESTN
jgi:DNA-binding SARP family transcriptional activator